MRANSWTDERIALLKALWIAGASARAIADRLGGVSRAAVRAKILRLRRGAAEAVDAAAASKAAANKRAERDKDGKRGKSLVELDNYSCRWPSGHPGTPRFFFCGAPGADLERGMPYCPRHAQRAYVMHDAGDRVAAPEKPADISTNDSPLVSPPEPARPRRYEWRSGVRHPAPRWK
jgi:GcrA cell cycle regulator